MYSLVELLDIEPVCELDDGLGSQAVLPSGIDV